MLGTMSGTIVARHVWMLPPGRRIVVPFNEFDQPIRKGGTVMVHFLSDIAKSETYCPLGDTSWKSVGKQFQKDIVEIVREKFVLPENVKIDKKILNIVSSHLKQHRCALKRQHYQPGLTQEQIIKRKPSGVSKDQWLKLFSYWQSKKSKKYSDIGQKARASHAHAHTTGSRSIAQWKIEFEKIHKRKPRSQLEFFKFTHATKEGGYVDHTLTQEFVDYVDCEVNKRAAEQSKEMSLPEIEDDVFNELMHSNDSNRVINYGHGVSKSDVFGLDGELRKRYYGSSSGSSEIQEMKCYLASVEKKNAECVSQLLKENQELRNKYEEVIKKNDAILSQVSIFMNKFDEKYDTAYNRNIKQRELEVQPQRCAWQAPPSGVLKWNVCGVIIKGSDKAGIGGILRDSDEDYFCLFNKPVYCINACELEFLAILEALKLTIGVNWVRQKELILESDSSIAISWAVNSSPCPRNMKDVHKELTNIMKQCTKVTFIHKERDENDIPNDLAKVAISRDEAATFWDDECKH